jgi:hypothetical protein
MRLRPQRSRSATRVVVATGVRGGVGRSLLAANLALRIGSRMRVCVVDATGHGTAGWWLRTTPRPWTELEGLVDELTADHLAVMAEETSSGIRVIGGTSAAPTPPLLGSTLRAASGLADLVIVDAPLRNDPLARVATSLADRVFVLAYDDPWSKLMLDADPPTDQEWLTASQLKTTSLDGRRAFRALPRDESAVASAVASRGPVKGALGKAYDELADLLGVDDTDRLALLLASVRVCAQHAGDRWHFAHPRRVTPGYSGGGAPPLQPPGGGGPGRGSSPLTQS